MGEERKYSVNSLVAEGGTDDGEPHMPGSWCRLPKKHNGSRILEKYLWQQDNLENEQPGSKSPCGHYTRNLSRSKQLLTSKSSQSSRREGHVNTALGTPVAPEMVLSVMRTRTRVLGKGQGAYVRDNRADV